MYSFENIIGERNSVLSPVINEKIGKTPVFIDWKWPIHSDKTKGYILYNVLKKWKRFIINTSKVNLTFILIEGLFN